MQGPGAAEGTRAAGRVLGFGHTFGALMSIRVIRLGTPREPGEGLRIGTVRRPPRGIRKADYARQNWFDVWLPDLAPSASLMRETSVLKDRSGWPTFARRYQAELKKPEPSRLLDLLAALSHQTSISIGCYCDDERYCHRSLLRQALRERGADVT
jgi:uncharacterized protein YeaO (DUF488 family)